MLDNRVYAPNLTPLTVLLKKYTEDHEWIELDSDGKTGAVSAESYFSGF